MRIPRKVRSVIALAVFAVALLAAACGGAASSPAVVASELEADEANKPTVSDDIAAPVEVDQKVAIAEVEPPVAKTGRTGDEELAPELKGITGWINTEPFTLEEHRGKVVLIDFWTYTCINCIRTLPFLKDWQEKYADQGLVIVGVHSPEFEFEKIKQNVVDAVAEFGLEYRVAQDNAMETWRAFKNRFWPAKYLIDKDGYIRYTHFGEGAYDETEEKIRELLAESGVTLVDFGFDSPPEREYDPKAKGGGRLTGLTRELYAGWERNYSALMSGGAFPPYVRHQEYYNQKDVPIEYVDPGIHENHFIYLHGEWRNAAESLVHTRTTQNYEDYIAILFYATSVNAVMGTGVTDVYEVRVTLNDEPLQQGQAGADVMWDDEGNSFVVVDGPRMYRIVEVPEFGGHELKLSSNSHDFRIFAYTFGAFKNDREA